MVTQQKASGQSDLRTMLDFLMIGLGMLGGGLAALAGLWLWFDYQAAPAESVLAQVSSLLILMIPPALQDQLSSQTRLMGLPLTGQTSAYWYMARAGGIVAYLLMWLSTVWGLFLSTKIAAKQIPPALAYGFHEFVSILTIVFAVLHAGVLLGDEYIKFNVFHLAIPFIAPYQPVATGLGTIALYLTIAIVISFYARKFIGQKMWRMLHYLTFAVYLLALSHAIFAGSDTGLILSVLLYWSTGFTVLFLTYYAIIMRLPKSVHKALK
jgi:predicted ferric reductase